MENYSEKEKLAKESRLNYKKPYTIEHNIKVCFIGKIHKDSEPVFFTEVKRILEKEKDEEPVEDTEEQTVA